MDSVCFQCVSQPSKISHASAPARSTEPSQRRKKVKAGARKLRARERRFIEDSKALTSVLAAEASSGSSVVVTESEARTAKPIARAETYALWRDASQLVKLTSFARALNDDRKNARPYVWTLRIDQRIIERERNPTDYMHRRIRRELKLALNRDCQLFGVAHVSAPGSEEYHFHGVIGLLSYEKEAASKALRKAGGDWRRSTRISGRQLQLKEPTNLEGWVDYCAREHPRVVRWLNAHRKRSGCCKSVDPQTYFVSRSLQQEAQALYTIQRESLRRRARGNCR